MKPAFLLLGIFLIAFLNSLAQKSISGQQDIGELMTIAKQTYDLSNEDAVILFDGYKVHWLTDGRKIEYIHRIIWIGTKVGVGRFGDHRIAYDNTHCTFNVVTVRTWRDNQWWETGETGKVETLPRALEKTYDYTNIQEMMLLHNGIELPCILEVAYFIEDKKSFRENIDGIWYFDKREPVVSSWFGLSLPKGTEPNVIVSGDIAGPEIESQAELSIDTYWWKAAPIPARPRPYIDNIAAESPHIIYSTWKGWDELGKKLNMDFEENMTLSKEMEHQLDSLLKDARDNIEKAKLIADFIEQKVTYINYDEKYWREVPRSAERTYETAYAHGLDKAILAGGMFKYAGLRVFPVYFGKGYGPIDNTVPTLASMDDINVWISGDNIEAIYNPKIGEISPGLEYMFGKTVWIPGGEEKPNVRIQGENEISTFEVVLNLKYDKKNDSISGEGYLQADNCLCPYGRMVGLEDESKTFIVEVASCVSDSVEVTEYNLSRFDLFGVAAGFKIKAKMPEKDDFERFVFEIGDATGDVHDHLTDDIDLTHSKRSSGIYLQCPMSHKITITFDVENMDIVYQPENKAIDNEVGTFKINSHKDENRLAISRELILSRANYSANEWPDLRRLLLADKHERNRTIILKSRQEE